MCDRCDQQRRRDEQVIYVPPCFFISVPCLINSRQDDEPYYTSAVTGEDWINDLLAGEPQRIRTTLGVNRGTFVFLVKAMQDLDLQPSHVSIEEQVGIFLYTAVTGLPCIHVAERFQHTPKVINK